MRPLQFQHALDKYTKSGKIVYETTKIIVSRRERGEARCAGIYFDWWNDGLVSELFVLGWWKVNVVFNVIWWQQLIKIIPRAVDKSRVASSQSALVEWHFNFVNRREGRPRDGVRKGCFVLLSDVTMRFHMPTMLRINKHTTKTRQKQPQNA